ncbi:cytochrome C biogenesis protein CcdA [Rhizobium sp. Root149]|jgi:cytochrome c-type biogenesis protein CcmE|uniref:Cytochrome c-type biogenesis protein CcmE n=2 Tax=Rhizobium TaxID=379 RepID=A0A7W6LE48_9HYPH|nr:MULTISPECIES: cytochrome c maturation protein CcmE [Rhizobium]KQZ63074.1 cytochrome C biogenesis protein CcdA [Rhizobium sp. Root149]MBB4142700.1 cytochrome c-type biogenesis protein CcmE [Rhizobium rhizoryzae]MCJ8507602.1 cytochrome c maturation protein CcmE [Rhizobium lemnae]
MTRKQKRMAVIAGGMSFILIAVLLVMFAFSQSVAYFFMPSDLAKNEVSPGTRIRLGGLVEAGSVQRGAGSTVSFKVTDGSASVPVSYTGILPDLFREGQGVVTEGVFTSSRAFVADSVLAKHDENYMPKEVADRLKADGVWKEGEGSPTTGAKGSVTR